jgi:sugar phosphate isomerase/epimerase
MVLGDKYYRRKMMKLSFVVTTPDVSAPDATAYSGPLDPFFQKLRQFGYQGVELMMRNPEEVNLSEISTLLAKSHLEVALVNTGRVMLDDGLSLMMPPGEQREEARQRICDVIDFAVRIAEPSPLPFGPQINAGLLRGRVAPGQDRAEARSWVVDNLRYVANYAAQRNARIALEPINRYQSNFINSAQQAIDLIQEVGTDNLGLQMDVFHMNIEERSLAGCFITYKDWITHIHICDTNRKAPGQGHLDFAEIVDTLHALGYQGYLSAELDISDQEEAAEHTASYLKSLFSAY